MKVKELIALLQAADPEAQCMNTFEDNIFPVEASDIRVGEVDHVCLLPKGEDRSEDYTGWYQHRLVTSEGRSKVLGVHAAVVLYAGEFDDAFTKRLENKPKENL